MQYPSKESIDVNAQADKFGVPLQSVANFIKQAESNPTVRGELRSRGYAESQIPAWISSKADEKSKTGGGTRTQAETLADGLENVEKSGDGLDRVENVGERTSETPSIGGCYRG